MEYRSLPHPLHPLPQLLELPIMPFPANRLRRLRRTGTLRALVRETRLTPESFVYPLFVCPGTGIRKAVHSMPGVFNLSVDELVKEIREARSLGVSSIILFGLPETKDEVATGAWAEDGILKEAGLSRGSEDSPIQVEAIDLFRDHRDVLLHRFRERLQIGNIDRQTHILHRGHDRHEGHLDIVEEMLHID